MVPDIYSTITTESVERLAHTLACRDIPPIGRFEPIADFDELITFTTENPTPVGHAVRNPVWRLESVSTRLIEAVAIAAHESTMRDAGWKVLAQIILEHAEYLYTYHQSQHPRERLQAGAALALVSSLSHNLPQSSAWRLAGFARIAESIDKIDNVPSYLIEFIDAAFELAVVLDLPIFGEAIDRYVATLNRNLRWNKQTYFKLSDVEFFNHLNLCHSGLEKVKSEWEWGALEEAESAYASAKQSYLNSTNWSNFALLLPRVLDSWESASDRFPVPNIPHQEGLMEAGRRAALEFPKLIIDRMKSPGSYGAMPFNMAKSYLEVTRYLSTYQGLDNAGFHVETSAIGVAALLFPEWRNRDQFLKLALRRYKWIHDDLILPDGLQTDGSNTAHHVALTCLLNFYQLACLCEFRLPQDFDRRCERLIEAIMYLSQPDNRLPLWDQRSSAEFSVSELCGVGHAVFNRTDFLYTASSGIAGVPPKETSHAFPYRGYYVMRGHWRVDAQYLVFDGGSLCSPRQHGDKLNFLLYAYGRPLIVNLSHFPTEDAAEDDAHPSHAHNTVIIDGKRQFRSAMCYPKQVPNPDSTWLTTPSFDFSEGWHKDGYTEKGSPNCDSNFLHKRSIFYNKGSNLARGCSTSANAVGEADKSISADGEYFILHDLVLGEGMHTLEQIFHLAAVSEGCVEVRDKNIVRTVEPDLSNLVIAPVNVGDLEVRLHCGATDAVGAVTVSQDELRPRTLTYVVKRILPTVLNTVLFPLRPGVRAVPELHPIEVGTNPDVLATGFTVAYNRNIDLVLISDDGFAVMATTDMEFAGEYLFLRFDEQGQPQRIMFINGQSLKWRGDVLVELPEPQAHYESIVGSD